MTPDKPSQDALDWADGEIKKVEQYKRDNPNWASETKPFSELRRVVGLLRATRLNAANEEAD